MLGAYAPWSPPSAGSDYASIHWQGCHFQTPGQNVSCARQLGLIGLFLAACSSRSGSTGGSSGGTTAVANGESSAGAAAANGGASGHDGGSAGGSAQSGSASTSTSSGAPGAGGSQS